MRHRSADNEALDTALVKGDRASLEALVVENPDLERIEALHRHRARQLEERLAAGAAWRDEDLMFCTPIGGAICGNHLSGRDFQSLLKRARLPRIRFHDLRHTCATLLLRQGVNPKIVQELLGHSTVAMTLDRYSRFLPDMQQAAVDAMDEVLSRGPFASASRRDNHDNHAR
jgi:integrase